MTSARASLLGLAALMATAPASAAARSQMPALRIGAYTDFGPCDQAANASLMWWNGRFFSAGGISNVIPRPSGRTTFVGEYTNLRDPSYTKKLRIKFVVRDRTHFAAFMAISDWRRSNYRFCPDASLPSTWRGMTPP